MRTIEVIGQYLFQNDDSGNRLIVYDVSNPSDIEQINALSHSELGVGNDLREMKIVGNYLISPLTNSYLMIARLDFGETAVPSLTMQIDDTDVIEGETAIITAVPDVPGNITVEFFVNGEPAGIANKAPYEFYHLTAPGSAGIPYEYTARAINLSGMESDLADPISFATLMDNQIPSIAINTPSENENFFEGTIVNLNIDASDNLTVEHIIISANNVEIYNAVPTAQPISLQLAHEIEQGPVDPQQVVFTVRAVDINGNVAIATRTINRLQDFDPPSVSVILPTSQQFVDGSSMLVMATATDNIKVVDYTLSAQGVDLTGTFNDVVSEVGYLGIARNLTGYYYDTNPMTLNFSQGFTFPFYGTTYSTVYIHNSGFLTFSGNSSQAQGDNDQTVSIDAFLNTRPRISAVFDQQWWDYAYSSPYNRYVAYAQYPDRLILYYHLYLGVYGSTSSINHYEITLFKTGLIQITYGTTNTDEDFDSVTGIVGITPGTSAPTVSLIDVSKNYYIKGAPGGAMFDYFDGTARKLNQTLSGKTVFFVPGENWQYTMIKVNKSILDVAENKLGMTHLASGLTEASASVTAIDINGNVSPSETVTISKRSDQAPTLSNLSVMPRQLMGNSVTISAQATDDIAVYGVTFTAEYDNGTILFNQNDTTYPYAASFVLPVASSNYSVTVSATAFDETMVSSTATATVNALTNIPPIAGFLAPVNGFEVTEGDVLTIQAFAYDQDVNNNQIPLIGSVTIDIEISQGAGAPITQQFVRNSSPYTVSNYPIPATAEGETMTISVFATDDAGDSSTVVTITGTITGDLPPNVVVTSPPVYTVVASGSEITATADASDDVGQIQSVRFFVFVDGVQDNDSASVVDTTAPYAGTVKIPNGTGSAVVDIRAKAIDSVGQVGISAPITLDIIISTEFLADFPTTDATHMRVVGDYAFVADGAGGLVVLNISDPLNISLVTSDATYTISDLVVIQNTIYAITSTNFVIFRFENEELEFIGETGNIFSSANDVQVRGQFAFVSDETANKLTVLDLNNPATPFEISGSQISVTGPKKIAIQGNVLILTQGTNGMATIDISNPRSPVLKNTYDTSGDARGISINNNIVYIADYGIGLLSYQLKEQTAELIGMGLARKLSGPNRLSQTQYVDVVGSIAFVSDRTNGIAMVNVENPFEMTLVGNASTGADAIDIDVVGDIAYIANDTSGIRLLRLISGQLEAPQIQSVSVVPTQVIEGNSILLTASATDDTGVTIEFLVNGEVVAVDNTVPFQFDYLTAPNSGPSTLLINANAIDLGGNITFTSALEVAVTVLEDNESPVISIIQPTDDKFLLEGTTTTVDISAQDNLGIQVVTVNVNGVQTLFNKPPFTIQNVPLPLGNPPLPLVISGAVQDINGNVTLLAEKSFAVTDDLSAPSVTITSPVNGLEVIAGLSVVSIEANVQDSGLISAVEFFVDGALVFTDTTTPYSYSLTVPGNAGHTTELKVRAEDISDNFTITAPVELITTFAIREITNSGELYRLYNNGSVTGGSFAAEDVYVVGDPVTNQSSLPTTVSPKWMYVANNSSLAVIDLINRSQSTFSTTAAHNIDYQGDFVYVARASSGLGTYYIANPVQPVHVGTHNFGTNGNVYDVKVRGQYAFTAAYRHQLQVLDISNVNYTNPTVPTLSYRYVGERNTTAVKPAHIMHLVYGWKAIWHIGQVSIPIRISHC
ncbi:MAG: hypothetical protein H7A34_04660 [bacterium]|nr:hypothetical protein [bacterium]